MTFSVVHNHNNYYSSIFKTNNVNILMMIYEGFIDDKLTATQGNVLHENIFYYHMHVNKIIVKIIEHCIVCIIKCLICYEV